MPAPRQKPLLVYDGDCGFCRKWVIRFEAWTRGAVEFEPYQKVAPLLPDVPVARFEASVVLVARDGQVSYAAEAVFKALRERRELAWLYSLYRKVPGFSWLSERIYAVVARNRMLVSRLTSWF